MLHSISFLRLGRKKEDKPHYLRLLRWTCFQSKWKLVLKEEFTNVDVFKPQGVRNVLEDSQDFDLKLSLNPGASYKQIFTRKIHRSLFEVIQVTTE